MVKVISLSEEAYELLKRNKKKDMSFSDVIIQQNHYDRESKKETLKDLVQWIETHSKKTPIRKKVKYDYDKIIYGVSRDC